MRKQHTNDAFFVRIKESLYSFSFIMVYFNPYYESGTEIKRIYQGESKNGETN